MQKGEINQSKADADEKMKIKNDAKQFKFKNESSEKGEISTAETRSSRRERGENQEKISALPTSTKKLALS